jgi:hypothetical protein
MKRTTAGIWIVAATFTVIFAALLVAAHAAVKRTVSRPWPGGLGSVEDVPKRYPPRERSLDASRLVVYAMPLDIELQPARKRDATAALKAFGAYVRQEQGNATRTIAPPAAEIAQYLETHARDLDLVREHLLHATIEWPLDLRKGAGGPMPNLLGHLQLNRVLVTRALLRGSWEDLHAAWRLAQALQSRPEIIAQIVALSMVRSINAAAWKMPGPAPAWLAEMGRVDYAWLLAAGSQAESWSVLQTATREGVPLPHFMLARSIHHQRRTAEKLLANRECGLDTARFFAERQKELFRMERLVTPNLASMWRRAFRYRAEREATMNAHRVLAGEAIVTRSVCSDGAWRFENGTLAFSRDLPKGEPQEVDMPLSLRLR